MGGERPAPRGRREQRKLDTILRIRVAARELFSEKGYEGTTVEEIADRADVAKATFFNYFPRKDALLESLAVDMFLELEEGLGPAEEWRGSVFEQFRRFFFRLAELVERDPGLSKVMLIENMRNFWLRTSSDPLEQRYRTLCREVLDRGRVRGEFAADFDVAVGARLLEAAYFTTMLEWLREGAPAGRFRRELTDKLVILFRGFGAAEPEDEGRSE